MQRKRENQLSKDYDNNIVDLLNGCFPSAKQKMVYVRARKKTTAPPPCPTLPPKLKVKAARLSLELETESQKIIKFSYEIFAVKR